MLPEKAEDSMQYSNDLRRKLGEAWLTGEHTPVELADLFHVSLGWVEKVLRRWRMTGNTGAASFHPGRYSVLSPDRVRQCVARHADATLAELGRRLHVSAPPLCRWLPRLGLPRTKRYGMPVSATRLVFKECGRVGGRRAVAGTRGGWCLSTKRASTGR
jgi:transposase